MTRSGKGTSDGRRKRIGPDLLETQGGTDARRVPVRGGDTVSRLGRAEPKRSLPLPKAHEEHPASPLRHSEVVGAEMELS